MNKPMDIIGKKFNRLTVLELVGTDKYGNTKFLCECDCGNRKILLGSKVKGGRTKNGFDSFYKWAIQNGYNANAEFGKCTIDRIDNNGDYEPSNCRWVDIKTQANNKRQNHLITFNGKTQNVTQWATELGFTKSTLFNRIRKGWSIEEMLTTPVKKYRRK